MSSARIRWKWCNCWNGRRTKAGSALKAVIALQNALKCANHTVENLIFRQFSNQFCWHVQGLMKGMILLTIALTPMLAAAGWSFLYLLCGGGLGGALLIFVVLKMFGK